MLPTAAGAEPCCRAEPLLSLLKKPKTLPGAPSRRAPRARSEAAAVPGGSSPRERAGSAEPPRPSAELPGLFVVLKAAPERQPTTSRRQLCARLPREPAGGKASSASPPSPAWSPAGARPPYLGFPPQEVAGEAEDDLRVQAEGSYLQQAGVFPRGVGGIGRFWKSHSFVGFFEGRGWRYPAP